MDRELLKKSFEDHGFKTSFFNTKEAAVEYLMSRIRGKKVAMGGSMTLKEMRMDEFLEKENEVIWHWNTPGKETLIKAREAEVYLTSANAASETGELVNIDGVGNRISQIVYGPEKIYFVVGRNKICTGFATALWRAKNIAAPRNAMRLKVNTPCVAAGGDKCYDCSSPDRICRSTVILERPAIGMEAEVVFIDEDLGY